MAIGKNQRNTHKRKCFAEIYFLRDDYLYFSINYDINSYILLYNANQQLTILPEVSNNNHPIFTVQKLLTVYLFCGAYQQYFKIKDIHTFTEEYLLSWFPNLPSYQTFNYGLNLMPAAISEFVRQFIHSFKPQDCDSMKSLVDSMPIITCAGKNKVGKVATEITFKGYCSTKNNVLLRTKTPYRGFP